MTGSPAADGPPPSDGAVQPAPSGTGRRKRRPRVVAQPQSLEPKSELTGSYRKLQRPSSVEQALAHRHSASTSAGDASPEPSGDPLAGLRAKDEDPAVWGEAKEDLAERLRREKPPHWG